MSLPDLSSTPRTGGPSDEPADYALDVWAGVVPVTTGFGRPEPDPGLRPGIDTPPHIVNRDALVPRDSVDPLAAHVHRGHRL